MKTSQATIGQRRRPREEVPVVDLTNPGRVQEETSLPTELRDQEVYLPSVRLPLDELRQNLYACLSVSSGVFNRVLLAETRLQNEGQK